MSGVSVDVYDLMCFEMVNSIVGNNWDNVVHMKDTETVKKIESFGHSIGYRWAEIKKIKSPAWNSLDEVIRDICSEFWADVFGVESASLHTDNTSIFVISSPSLRPLLKIRPQEHREDRMRYYALFYKGMIDGIISLAGFHVSTSFRKNRNSGEYEFIISTL
ncbi:hypothetical protein WA577_005408 [Blastocystis sp. JDR]